MKHQWGHKSGSGTYINTEFSPEASVYGKPYIRDSKVLGGEILGGKFISSTIHDQALFNGREAIQSTLKGRSRMLDKSYALLGCLGDQTMLLDSGQINHVIMQDFAMVCGTGVAIGGTEPLVLKEYDYIDRGVWYRRPITFVTSGGFIVTENVEQLVTVSCTTNTVKKWLGGAGRRYGRMLGLPAEEIDEIEHYVAEIGKLKA